MADSADAGAADAHITFKVKTSGDKTHVITMAGAATVFELKTKLAGEDLENVPVERQRLIYSGRVMKNDDSLASYKIKPNNTIHMVKSAASNPSQPASSSTPTPRAVPTNMASGTANNPLAGLTGARYAGHQVHLPGMEMFGPDGGMGPPIDGERLQRTMADPNVQQAMREALSNPDFVNMLIESNPMLRNMPGARELITSPEVLQMMSNPDALRNAMQLQQMMGGAEAAFPAPGATDTTPDSATAGDGSAAGSSSNQPDPLRSLLAAGAAGAAGASGAAEDRPDLGQLLQALSSFRAMTSSYSGATPPFSGGGPGQSTREAREPLADPNRQPNPFSALFPLQGGPAPNSPEVYRESMRQMLSMLGGAEAPASVADTRPPEERYADQLRQLNDMGFCDFERNVAALRRSGGSVQGAIEHLLSVAE